MRLRVHNRTFIYLSGWVQIPFKKQYEDLKKLGDWHMEKVHSGHNIMKEYPEKLTNILIQQKYAVTA